MIKIITIIGARPQFIKAAAFSHALKSEDTIEELILHTGQHYDQNMSDVFFKQLGIPLPDYRLDSGGKSHAAMTGSQLMEIEKILLKEQPDYVVLYGDTNSTLSGALAASKLHIPIVHIEAGLRSYNMKMPEEINRILTDRMSQFLFCPSQNAKDNLIKEGYNHFKAEIHVVGDIMLDAIKLFIEHLKIKRPYDDPYIVCTVHRQENTVKNSKLKEIINGLNKIAKTIKIVVPLHPRTRKLIKELNLKINKNLSLTEPMSYVDFLSHIKYCELVITDSGGLQKESYFMKKNCLVVREETEWTELIENKNNLLVDSKADLIHKAFQNRNKLSQNFTHSFYGDGDTSKKIVQVLKNHFALN